MSEKSPDRRTLKTRRAIRDALATLLAQKELHKVTVQEITDIADINRGTFYKHCLDVYDLYDQTEQEILVDIGLLVLELQKHPQEKSFTLLIDYIDGNRTVFKMIFSPNSTGQLREKLSKCIDGLFRQIEAEKKETTIRDTKLGFQTYYRSQGVIAILDKWVSEDFVEPKEQVIKILTELDTNTEKLIKQK